ncbi:hypothetical protein ASPCAL11832 [Aspergillus calidoustus]|uniref:Uncharacterized protein n=1 Tax=Aspergillus calidoustus TaxID=454130 RepID=A0A0U5GFQ7_ASPCI|nr:hypothetical protein ASPCAL11832 [Aspergillus calidoustus]
MNSSVECPDTSALTPGSSGEILGPTVLFWMVCFAINSMTQPTGRVLGIPYDHPSILRSSPIICAFDAIEVLAEWASLAFNPSSPMTLGVAAFHLVHHRTRDAPSAHDAVQAIKRIKEQTQFRWATFLIGTVPQYIKLFASRGTPFSTAFGTMYLASWLLFEALFWAAPIDSLSVYAVPAIPQFKRDCVRRIWARTATVCSAIVYYAPYVFLVFVLNHRPDEYLEPSGWEDFRVGPVMGATSFIFPCGGLGFWSCFWWEETWTALRTRQLSRREVFLWGAFILVSVSTTSLTVYAVFVDLDKFAEVPSMIRMITFLSVGGLGSLLAGIAFVTRRELWGMDSFDIMRLAAMIHLPVLYYCLFYDPADTHQPSWLQWLG